MTVDEIRELIRLVSETDVVELEVQRGEHRVRIRRGGQVDTASHQPFYYPSAGTSAPPHIATPGQAQAPSAREPASTPADDPSLKLVKSPIVGTFYDSPSPDLPPFVRVGEKVQPGRVLCIIESMKLMNEIEAEFAGIVESKLVPNGQPVEYGEALFSIRAV